MRTIKITADSSCDLFTLEQAPFSYAPMKVITADREFVDDTALDVDAMVDYLETYKGASKSSCPNTNDWLEAFGDADDVFCVTITGALSGSCNSANAAKKIYEAEHPGRRVYVIDSLSAGPEVSMLVWKLESLVAKGMDYEQICSEIADYGAHTGLVFYLKSLKTFANNGRISPIVAKLVGIAGICIVGRASTKGTLEPMHKCRGEARSLKALVDSLTAEGYAGGRVSIGHSRNQAAAEALAAMIGKQYAGAEIEIHALHGLCSFYAECGGILVGFEKA